METRICNKCGIEKPIELFHKNYSKSKDQAGLPRHERRVVGYRHTCKQCNNKRMGFSAKVWAVERRLKENLKEAPFRAAVRMLKDNPDLLPLLVKAGGLQKYKLFLDQERKAIILESRERSEKYVGRRRNVDPDDHNRVLEAAIRRLNGKKPGTTNNSK